MELIIPNRALDDDTYKLYIAYANDKKTFSSIW